MKSKVKVLLIVFGLVLGALNPVFVTAGIPEAVTYLQGQTQDPWVTMALVSAGQSAVSTDHLSSVSGNLATDYAKTILALTALGENPTSFGSVDYVAQLKTYHSNTQMGDDNLLNDDMWSILALSSVGQDDIIEVSDAKNTLISNQNSDGGWSYAVGADSDTNDTAAAIIALIEAGVSATDQVIIDALAYIATAQNSDGGIGYQVGNASDSGSDAWVISALIKAGIDPTAWDKSGNNPITHLESLQADDGGFWWVEEGTSDWNNKAMTAYAVIALAQKTFPIGYYNITDPVDPPPTPGSFRLRIEGVSSTICDAYVSATTALDIIENGAVECGYTYTIEDTAYGPYLTEIAGETAEGLTGWLYFVDYVSPPVGAADYVLEEGEEVIWYFGDWGWPPLRITADNTEIEPGESVNIQAEYFNGSNWLPAPAAKIMVNGQESVTDATGSLSLTLDSGIYELYADKDDFIRSEKNNITVGALLSKTVNLQVEIDQTTGGPGVHGETIAMTVTPDSINFGILKPGESASDSVTLSNTGTVNLQTGASISGDSVFVDGIKIDGESHSAYSGVIDSSSAVTIQVGLMVDQDYLGSGIKTGELIFWGSAQ